MTTNYSQNITLSYFSTFLGGLNFALPIMALYYEQELGTVFLITFILSIQSASIILLEVPTGIITDRFGRKKSMILSSIAGIGNLLLILRGTYLLVFIIAMIFSALSNTLSSGTMTSLVYETITELQDTGKDPPPYKRVSAILHSLWPLGASIASIIGGVLAQVNLKLPIALMLVPSIIKLYLISRLNDPYELKKDAQVSSVSLYEQTKRGLRIVFNNRQVLILTGISFFSYIGEVAHKLKPLYFAYKEISLGFFGVLYSAAFGLSFIGSFLSDPISRRLGNKKTLITIEFISSFTSLCSFLTTGIISGIFLVSSSISWGILWPVISELMNEELDDESRTMVLSMNNMFKMASFTLFAPIFGHLVDIFDVQYLYWINWWVSIVFIFPYFFLKSD